MMRMKPRRGWRSRNINVALRFIYLSTGIFTKRKETLDQLLHIEMERMCSRNVFHHVAVDERARGLERGRTA
jgi:hypothetical protein